MNFSVKKNERKWWQFDILFSLTQYISTGLHVSRLKGFAKVRIIDSLEGKQKLKEIIQLVASNYWIGGWMKCLRLSIYA